MVSEGPAPEFALETVTTDARADAIIDNGAYCGTSWDLDNDFEDSTAYLVEFGGTKPSRRVLRGPEDLEAEVHAAGEAKARRLLVIHGLPSDYLELLRDCFGLEAEFVNAIAGKRLYRPGRHSSDWKATSYEYPVLVKSQGSLPMLSPGRRPSEEQTPAERLGVVIKYPLSGTGHYAIFCRASVWSARPTDFRGSMPILFLDRPTWRDPAYALQQVSTDVFTTKSCDCGSGKPHAWHLAASGSSQEFASLESRIWKELCGTEIPVTEDALASLPSFAYDFWTELLETISLATQSTPSQWLPLSQQMLRSLERNLDMADLESGSEAHYWRKLLDKLERRERLAQQLVPVSFQMEVPAQDPMPPSSVKIESSPNQRRPADADENKRSLDRVAYLGGVLLPMSIVSGILAMGDTFGPGGDMFFVFWATAVPLTVLTLLLIYADSIRKVEVWIEEAQSTHSTTGLFEFNRRETGDLEQAVEYSYTESIAVDNRMQEPVQIGIPGSRTASAPAPARTDGRRHGDERGKVWKKEELGWIGACKAILRIYRLQDIQKSPAC